MCFVRVWASSERERCCGCALHTPRARAHTHTHKCTPAGRTDTQLLCAQWHVCVMSALRRGLNNNALTSLPTGLLVHTTALSYL